MPIASPRRVLEALLCTYEDRQLLNEAVEEYLTRFRAGRPRHEDQAAAAEIGFCIGDRRKPAIPLRSAICWSIAKKYEVSVGTVKTSISRARRGQG
jgi:hypothetical protein